MQINHPPPASLALAERGIPHRVFVHAGPVTSLEQAARERGHRPEQVVRSILFRTGKDEYLLALVAGPAPISWKALRSYLGRSRLTMASEDEVLQVTGYPVGAVSPFGTARKLRVVADAGVFAEQEVSLGSGLHGVAVILKREDFRRALGEVEVVSLCEEKCVDETLFP